MIGVDEAGRGAWAGPLLAVAVRLPADLAATFKDSKLLSESKRETFADIIEKSGADAGACFIPAELIDKHGLSWAQTEAMTGALAQIQPHSGEEIIIDGSINYVADAYPWSRAVIKADGKYPSVMAAAILAKVRRDAVMRRFDADYPGYGFASHKGYGTKQHQASLAKAGACRIHRLSYKPLAGFATRLKRALAG